MILNTIRAYAVRTTATYNSGELTNALTSIANSANSHECNIDEANIAKHEPQALILSFRPFNANRETCSINMELDDVVVYAMMIWNVRFSATAPSISGMYDGMR